MEEYTVYYTNNPSESELAGLLNGKLNLKTVLTLQEFEKLVTRPETLISAVVLDLNPYEEKYLKFITNTTNDIACPIIVVIKQEDGGAYNDLLAAGAGLVLFTPFAANILTDRLEKLSLKAKESYEKSWQEKTYTSLLFDPKTGIYSEKAFFYKSARYLADNTNKTLFAATCEVKNLMQIMLSLGQTFADNLLKYIATEIKDYCDKADIPYGILENDVFAVICDDSYIDLSTLNTKINGLRFSDVNREFGLIYGIYEITDKSMTLSEIMHHSLTACSYAYNRTCGYAVFDARMRNDMRLSEFVLENYRKAFDNKEFKVYYQPVVALNSNKVVACEALARWVHPDLGVIPPDKFIPLFEEHGIIPELDLCIWKQVCKDMRDRIDTGTHHIVPISINMSRIDFYNDHLVEDLNGVLASYGVDHKYIRIEITESALMDNDEKLYAMAEKLRSNGYVILMDDFGTGYSSFESLGRIPVDILKLDMQFIKDLKKNSKTPTIVSSIIRMCKFLNIGVVAEGIEEADQRDFLRGTGCEYGQGYLYSRPLPVDEFHALIEGKRLTESEQIAIDKREIDLKSIWDVESNFSNLFNNMITPIGFYEYDDIFGLSVVRANNAYFELVGGKMPERYSNPNDVFRSDYRQNKTLYDKMLKKSVKTGQTVSATMQRHKYDGKKFPCTVSLKYLGSIANKQEFVFCLNDATKEYSLRKQLDAMKALLAKN